MQQTQMQQHRIDWSEEMVHSLLALSSPTSSEATSTSRSTKSSFDNKNKLSSARSPSTHQEASSLVPSFCRRGLVNRQNTCFYNCIFQSLLACEEFWSCCSQLSNILSTVDPKLQAIDQASDAADGQTSNGKANPNNQFHIQVHHASNETNGEASDLDRTIPIIHELLLFAAHFRARTNKKPSTLSPSSSAVDSTTPAASPTTAADYDASATSQPSSAAEQQANGTQSPVDDTPQVSPVANDDNVTPPQPLIPPTDDSAVPADATSTDAATSTSASSANKAKRKKKKGGQDDDAFLDSIIASTSVASASTTAEADADEEERRKAKNRKKKEKEREKAAKLKEEQRLQQQQQQEDEQKQKEQAQQAPAVQQVTEEIESLSVESSEAAPASETAAPLNKRARRAAAKAAAAAAAGATVDSSVPEDDAVEPTTFSPSAAPKAPQTKQHRVHRVEDEEEFNVPVTTNGKPKGKSGDKQQQQQQKSKSSLSALSTSTPSGSPAASPMSNAPTFVPSLGKPIDSHSFLPSFPQLLKNFRSYRQGQQEDAQEFLQVMLENLQREWTQFISPLKQMYGIESSNTETSVANTEFQSAADDWNEVGRGSRAIKVVSNIAFQPSPFSRLFSGRIRSQLTVASRANDTMSFQPFFALHLDIDEQPVLEEDKSQVLTAAQKKHRKRKEKGMSVEKALERYMCPSEIEGYRKRNAASAGYDAYGNPLAATTRALHMHALDSHCLPRILVLHLKRFEQHDSYASSNSRAAAASSLHKNSKFVSFSSSLQLPARYLSTASNLASSNATSGVEYSLAAIVVHLGHSMSNGHYISYVRDRSQEVQKSTPAASPATSTSSSSSSKQSSKKSNSASFTPASAKRKKPVLKSSFEVADSDEDDEDEDDAGSSKSSTESESKARAIDREIWYQCDDTRITPVPAHSVYAQTAYLLFYTLEDK